MKKIILSISIVLVFIAYSFILRHKVTINIPRPASLSQIKTPSVSSSSGGGTAGGNSGSSTTNTYKNGTYAGSVANAYYGNVQVEVTIASGKITSVQFLQYPDTHSTSVYINQQAMPYLQQEAIQTQSSNVNIITGATLTSQAFIQSLASALSEAGN